MTVWVAVDDYAPESVRLAHRKAAVRWLNYFVSATSYVEDAGQKYVELLMRRSDS